MEKQNFDHVKEQICCLNRNNYTMQKCQESKMLKKSLKNIKLTWKRHQGIFQPQFWSCTTTQGFYCLFLKNCQKASKIYRKSEGLAVTHPFLCFAFTFLSISFFFQMRTYPFYYRLRPCKSQCNQPTVDQKYDLNEFF